MKTTIPDFFSPKFDLEFPPQALQRPNNLHQKYWFKLVIHYSSSAVSGYFSFRCI